MINGFINFSTPAEDRYNDILAALGRRRTRYDPTTAGNVNANAIKHGIYDRRIARLQRLNNRFGYQEAVERFGIGGKRKSKDGSEKYNDSKQVAVKKKGALDWFKNEDGNLDAKKVAGTAALGLGAAYLWKKNRDAKKKREEQQARDRQMIAMMAASEPYSNSNYSEERNMNTINDVFIGSDGVAIAGAGAAEAMAATLGEYVEYADNDQVVALAVDSLRAAQVTKLDNGVQFAEQDMVDLDSIDYSVGDTVTVTPDLSGRIIEILPVPASFSDPTMNYQVLLDNGALCNVTDSGNLWVEMSEDGTVVTTPICKFSQIAFGEGATFSTYDLGLIDPHHADLAQFSIQDYFPAIEDDYQQFNENQDYNQEQNQQYSEDYVIGYNIAQQGNFSDAEIVSYARTNNLNLNEIVAGYNDAKALEGSQQQANFSQGYDYGYQSTQQVNFSVANPAMFQPVNFSVQDYNTTLDEINSWQNDKTI